MRISIVQRLWMLVVAALLALVTVGAIGGYMARSALARLDHVHTSTLPALQTLNAVERNFFLIRVNAYAHVVADAADRKTALEGNVKTARDAVAALFGDIEKQLIDNTDRGLLETDRKAFANYVAILDEVLEASRGNDVAKVREIVASRWKPAGDAVTANLKAHTDYHKRLADEGRAQAAVDEREGQWTSWGVIVVGAVLMFAFGAVLVRDIGRGILALEHSVLRIGNELDFTVRAPVHGRDELGEMANAFNALIERLQSNLRAIQQSAQEVAGAAGTLATTSGEVATASEQQSSAAASDGGERWKR